MHGRHRVFAAKENALSDDRILQPELLGCAVFRGGNDNDPGFVDQYVEPAVTFHNCIDDLFPRGLVGDVVSHEFRLPARCANRFGSGLASGFVDIGEDDGRAFSRQDLRVRETQTRGCTGFVSDFSTYATHSFDSLGFGHARPGKKHAGNCQSTRPVSIIFDFF